LVNRSTWIYGGLLQERRSIMVVYRQSYTVDSHGVASYEG
jgi:hypothetical protein